MAVGKRSLLHPDRARKVESMVLRIGKEKGVKVLRFVNGGHHLHLLVLPRSRKAFNGFVRSISGVAARLSLSKERGPASTTSGSSYRSPGTFWDARPLTRILRVRSDVRQIIRMIQKPDQWLDDFWKKIARFSSA